MKQAEIELLTLISDLVNSKEPSRRAVGAEVKRLVAEIRKADRADLLDALKALFENCAMIHNSWGDNSNSKQADEAIKAALAAIRKAEGE